jgi:dTDP-4-amino-4,6-dideoxygalactose transaminase
MVSIKLLNITKEISLILFNNQLMDRKFYAVVIKMIPAMDLKRQYLSIKDEIDLAIKNVFEKGQFILGENVYLFEKEFASYCNVNYGIGVSSGTDAIHLALLACGVKNGDEVITVSNTAAATALAITYTGAKPVFVDIDPLTYNMDISKVECMITPRTKAIIPVHLFGQPVEMDPLMDLRDKYNLKIIEDACQAHGAEYRGKKVGSIGDIGCFSFYPTKNLGAYGDGGIVITNNDQLAESIKLMRNYGQEKQYHSLIKGYNNRLDEIHAAVLRVKLKKLDSWNEKRKNASHIYCELLEGCGVIVPTENRYSKHVYHLYVIRSNNRSKLRKLLTESEISTNIHYPVPIHLQKAFNYLKVSIGSLPTTERYADQVLSLPIFPEVTYIEVEEVSQAIRKANH